MPAISPIVIRKFTQERSSPAIKKHAVRKNGRFVLYLRFLPTLPDRPVRINN